MIDTELNDDATFYGFTTDGKSPAVPQYYAVLCGFHDLVEHLNDLITKHPQDVNAGGYYVRPILAALVGEHFQIYSVSTAQAYISVVDMGECWG